MPDSATVSSTKQDGGINFYEVSSIVPCICLLFSVIENAQNILNFSSEIEKKSYEKEYSASVDRPFSNSLWVLPKNLQQKPVPNI